MTFSGMRMTATCRTRELLESLALEKLNQAVEPLKAEGYTWVQVRTTFDYSDRAEFGADAHGQA